MQRTLRPKANLCGCSNIRPYYVWSLSMDEDVKEEKQSSLYRVGSMDGFLFSFNGCAGFIFVASTYFEAGESLWSNKVFSKEGTN